MSADAPMEKWKTDNLDQKATARDGCFKNPQQEELFPDGKHPENKRATFVSLKALIKDFFKTLEYSFGGRRAPFIMPTGFIVLDAILEGGFHDSELIVLTGSSGISNVRLGLC